MYLPRAINEDFKEDKNKLFVTKIILFKIFYVG